MKTLAQKQRVRLASWSPPFYATAQFVETAEDIERAESNGHATAFVVYAGAVVADSSKHYDKEDKLYASAVVLKDKELVEINGAGYMVKVIPGNEKYPRHSDPIHFVLRTKRPPTPEPLLPEGGPDAPRQMLDVNKVLELVPISGRTLARMVARGTFPDGRIVAGRKLWFADDVVRWQLNLDIRMGRKPGKPG